ncbi:MAG: SH3 domain-containing protein [Christensenellales bacterium]
MQWAGYSKLGTAPKGSTYNVIGAVGSWCKIDYNGKTSYEYSVYTSVTNTPVPEPTPAPEPTSMPVPVQGKYWLDITHPGPPIRVIHL